MRSDIALSVNNLTKKYRIFGHPGDRLKQAFTLGRVRFHREYTALHDISFDISKGEAVGIIGRNGSGKSTLLQLICGILKPSSGSVEVNGRIAALLELGSGFNPEFTGRENVFFQGAVLGIPKEEMESRFDGIAAFADIGEFIDLPVRTYSSGMFVRLAFSVALQSDPDLLIVDEALAVGDESFQRKCYAKLMDLRNNGKSLLFVSHSANVIATVCQRALLLDQAHLLADGTPAIVLAQYQKLLHIPHERIPTEDQQDRDVSHVVPGETHQPGLSNAIERNPLAYPPSGAIIDLPQLSDENGMQVRTLQRGQRYTFQYRIRFQSNARQVRYTMMVKTVAGFELGGLTSHLPGKAIGEIANDETVTARLEFTCRLLPGTYFLNAGVLGDIGIGEQFLHRVLDVLSFRVAEEDITFQGGVVDFS